MNLSLLRVLLLSVALLGSQTPTLSHGQRSSAAQKEAAKKKAAAQSSSRKQAPGARSRSTSTPSRARQAPPRASTPNRNSGNAPVANRPNAKPKASATNAQRPAAKATGRNSSANRSTAPRAKAPAAAANRPAPKAKGRNTTANRPPTPRAKAPAAAANRPAPKATGRNTAANRPAPKATGRNTAANRPPAPKAKAPATAANRPASRAKGQANTANRPPAPKAKGPANSANRPASRAKGPANVANRPAPNATGPASRASQASPRPADKVAARPAPKLPANVAKRSQAKPSPAAARGRAAFVPGKIVDRGKANPSASRDRAARNANHPASRANRARPQALNQVIAGSNVNSNNRTTNVSNISNVSNRTSLYSNNNWGNQWTNNRTSIWNSNRVVNNRSVHINSNFGRSYNYAYRPSSWGSRPWWSSPTYHTWHHGSWNYGWNRTWRSHHYHRPYFPGYRSYDSGRSSLAWGLAAWSLGSLAYDTGYYSYQNPYQAPPVETRTTVINYTQPLSVVAARQEPQPEEVALTSQEQSTLAMERARAEFGNGDYLAALQSTDEAISFAASDSALHEFRALCLFALGRYGDAAGVLNPVLASGPGWDWETMAAFYPDGEVYTGQLRKLETYVESNVESPDAHFVLGYHYLVAGYIDESYAMFDQVVTLQPNDRVAMQLRNLAESSSPNAEGEDPGMESSAAEPAPSDTPEVAVEPIEPTDLEGGWKAASADGKTITLTLDPAGTFTWNYEGAEEGKVLAGDWSIDEESRIVLAATDVQMVADISLDGDTLLFVLAGSPVGDPGLSFKPLSP